MKLPLSLKLALIVGFVAVYICLAIYFFTQYSLPGIHSSDSLGYVSMAEGKTDLISPFQGPAYPLAIRFLSHVGINIYTAAKLVSLFAGLAFVASSIYLLSKMIPVRFVFLLAVAMLTTQYLVVTFSFLMLSDMLGVAMFMVSVSLIIAASRSAKRHVPLLFAAGIASAIAYLTRYIYIVSFAVLIAYIFSLIAQKNSRRRLIIAAASFAFGFFILAGPWMGYLYHQKGSPFWNQNYLSVVFAMNVHGGITTASRAYYPQPTEYPSLVDYIRQHPRLFVETWIANLTHLPFDLARFMPHLGTFYLLGLTRFVARVDTRKFVLFAGCAAYGLVVVLTVVEPRYFLPFVPLWSASMAWAVALIPQRIRFSTDIPWFIRFLSTIPLRNLVAVAIICVNVGYSIRMGNEKVADIATEFNAAVDWFEEQHLDISTTVVWDAKRYISYFVGYTPAALSRREVIELSLEELGTKLKEANIDYFIYDQRYLDTMTPQLHVLLDPSSNPFPNLLEPVFYLDDPYKITVYRIIR